MGLKAQGRQFLTHAPAVAALGIFFQAHQAHALQRGYGRCLAQGKFRFRAGEGGFHNRPERFHIAPDIGLAAGFGRSERLQMAIRNAGLFKARGKSAFGKASAPGIGQFAHVNQRGDAGCA